MIAEKGHKLCGLRPMNLAPWVTKPHLIDSAVPVLPFRFPVGVPPMASPRGASMNGEVSNNNGFFQEFFLFCRQRIRSQNCCIIVLWSVAVQVVGDLRIPVAPFLCLVQKTCLIAGGANEPVLEAAAQWEDQWRWGMADSCSANVSTITSFWESPFTACSCSVEMKKESVSL